MKVRIIRFRVLAGALLASSIAASYLIHSLSTIAKGYGYDICFDDRKTDIDNGELDAVIDSLNLSGNDLNILMLRSNCYIKKASYELALLDVNKVINTNPNFGLAHHTRAKIYYLTDEYEKAITDLKHSIRHHLGDIDDHLLLADSYKALGKLNSAEKTLLDAVNHLRLGNQKYESGTKIVRTAYDEIPLYLALSDLLNEQHKLDRSMDVLAEAVDRSNGSVELFDAFLSLLESQNEIELMQKYRDERCQIPNIQVSKFCQF